MPSRRPLSQTPRNVKLRARRLLARLFRDRGNIRKPSRVRRREEGYDAYKKGTEVRLIVPTRAALADARRALRTVGLTPATPFAKRGWYVQPVYGRDAVAWFEQHIFYGL